MLLLHPYKRNKYILKDNIFIFERKSFLSGKKVRTEINLEDIRRVRITPKPLSKLSSTEVLDKNKNKISMGPRTVGTGKISEYESLVNNLLKNIPDNRNIEYISGGNPLRFFIIVIYPPYILAEIGMIKFLYYFLLTGQFMQVLATLGPTILGAYALVLVPGWFINSKENFFDPKIVVEYGPQILFNKSYQRNIFEQTGEDISQYETKKDGFTLKGAFGGLLTWLCIGLIVLYFMHNHYQRTAVLHAAYNGTKKEVVAALEDGGSVNAKNEHDRTALMMAVENNDLEVIETLIRQGADVNAYGGRFHYRTALMIAAKHRGSEVINALIEEGANVNTQVADFKLFEGGMTALMFAAEYNNDEAIKTLLEAGANVNTQDADGETALMYAAKNNDSDVTKALLKAGADVNLQDEDGRTALMYATEESEYIEVVNKLLDAGANASLQDEDGKTALDYAKENYSMRHSDVYSRLKKETKED